MANLSILILEGEAEARFFAGAEAVLHAGFPACEVRCQVLPSTRSDRLVASTPRLFEPRDLVILSLLADVAGDDSPVAADVATALAPTIERLQEAGSAVALCNVFRHVPGPLEHRLGAPGATLRERIRAMNLEVTRLSRRTGCFVLDVDRALAHEGGRALGADCFGGDGKAAELAMEELFALVLEAVPAASTSLGAS